MPVASGPRYRDDKDMIFHQLFDPESSTYTYVLGDSSRLEAVIIDPVLDRVDRDLKLIEELGVGVRYIIDTHIHADHITAASELRKKLSAKTVLSYRAKVDCVDIKAKEGDILRFGEEELRVLETPGHTDTCLSLLWRDMVFTGDALLIRGCGRTDFQQGSSETLYHSVTQKLFRLPGATRIFPGHDYKGHTSSTVEQERRFNPRLGRGQTQAQFIETMAQLRLQYPKKIDVAVPANQACGNSSAEKGESHAGQRS